MFQRLLEKGLGQISDGASGLPRLPATQSMQGTQATQATQASSHTWLALPCREPKSFRLCSCSQLLQLVLEHISSPSLRMLRHISCLSLLPGTNINHLWLPLQLLVSFLPSKCRLVSTLPSRCIQSMNEWMLSSLSMPGNHPLLTVNAPAISLLLQILLLNQPSIEHCFSQGRLTVSAVCTQISMA